MPDSIDQDQLLRYVEDELTAAEADAVHQRLAAEPALLAAVERLREDRAVLRGTPEPELPRDLVAGLESILARPMLVDSEPGHYRRQRRQRRRRPLLVPIAAAAGLVLVGAVVITLLTVALNRADAPGVEPIVAVTPPAAGQPVSTPDIERDDAWPPGGSTIHHAPPTDAQLAAVDKGQAVADPEDSPVAPAPASNVLPFALVVSGEPGAAQDLLGSHVAGHATDMAFVRNFSFEEAVQIEQRWLLRRDGGPARPAVVAGGSGSGAERNARNAYEELVQRVRQQLGDESSTPTSGTIAGRRGLEPTLEEQLQLSRRGAGFTIAIPVSRLNELLACLAKDAGLSASLRLLPDDVDAQVAQTPDWASERTAIRDAVEAYRVADDDRLVLLPVALRTESRTDS